MKSLRWLWWWTTSRRVYLQVKYDDSSRQAFRIERATETATWSDGPSQAKGWWIHFGRFSWFRGIEI